MENKDRTHRDQLGLSHPEDYFKDMQQGIFAKLKEGKLNDKTKTGLGLDVPDTYFEHSREEILVKIRHQTKEIDPVYFTRKFWMAFAASIAIMVSVSIWFNQDANSFRGADNLTSAHFQEMDGEQMMLNSLFVKDGQFDLLLDDYLYENIVVESAVPIIDNDDITLESLFIDDQTVDDLVDELWLEDELD